MASEVGPQTNILSRVNTSIELPTVPEVLTRLDEVTARPNSSADQVAAIVSEDPAVPANMLRIVNPSFYGLPARVSSLRLAIPVLGSNMTKRVALRASVFSAFG